MKKNGIEPLSILAQRLNALDQRMILALLRYAQQRQAQAEVIKGLLQARLIQLTSRSRDKSQSDDELLTVPQVAKVLRVGRDYLYKSIKNGHIPAVNLGERQLRVRRGDLHQYLQSSKAR